MAREDRVTKDPSVRVLVTGASGFLGRALLPRLVAAGHRVTALVHRGEAPGSDLLRVDLASSDARGALAPWRWDAVLHLAGPAPKDTLDWEAGLDTVLAHARATL